MTNREAFNRYVREEVEKQLQYMERMTNVGLVNFTIAVPDYHIEKNIHDALCYFKATHAPMPVGPKAKMIAWLDEEYADKGETE